MKEYKTANIRNVVLLGHGGSGKTSLAEAMLYASGGSTRLGKVEEGTTVSDFEPEEVRRHISISTALVPIEWNGHKINVIDAPGYTDFVGEVKGAIRAADAALILVDASSGVEVGTELSWSYLDEEKLPRAVVVAKMDRENARFEQVLVLGRAEQIGYVRKCVNKLDLCAVLLRQVGGHIQRLARVVRAIDGDEDFFKHRGLLAAIGAGGCRARRLVRRRPMFLRSA